MKKSEKKGMPTKVKIYVHNRLFAEGLRELLEREEGYSVVGTCSQPEEWEAADKKKADILIADMDSFHALSSELPLHGSPKVLLVGDPWQDHSAVRQLQSLVSQGLAGIIPPDSTVGLLKKSIKAVSEGELWLNRKLLEKIITARGKERPPLTRQEKKVVALICQGNRNKEVAVKLGIAEQTVKSHCNRIYKKLGVTDRLQLALYGYQNGEGSNDLSH